MAYAVACDFCLCMENNKELPGYITEKIFNAFFSGCVPSYQGDLEVARWIPADTFVSMEGIETGAELVRGLQGISRGGDSWLPGARPAFLGKLPKPNFRLIRLGGQGFGCSGKPA